MLLIDHDCVSRSAKAESRLAPVNQLVEAWGPAAVRPAMGRANKRRVCLQRIHVEIAKDELFHVANARVESGGVAKKVLWRCVAKSENSRARLRRGELRS